ncbi:MAG: hypothetical protein AABY64_00100 [Bdellovibrionota bacterium]
MNNLKAYLNLKFRIPRQHKKNLSLLALLTILTLPYQNCGKFEAENGPGSVNQSSTLSNQNPTPGTVPPPPPGGTGLTPAQIADAARVARCQTYIQKPVITNAAALGSTVLNLTSGLGTRSGDSNSAVVNVDVNAAKGIANLSAATADSCVPVATLLVAPETMNNSYAAIFSSGVTIMGDPVTGGNQATHASAILNRVFTLNNSNAFTGTSVPFRIDIQDGQRSIRCGAGTLYYRVIVRVTANVAVNPAAMNSDPVYVRANFSNACWNETKLPLTINSASANAGHKVAIDGNWAAVLSPKEDNMGAVFMFSKSGNTWSFTQKISVNGAASGQTLSNVALKGGMLAISNATFGAMGRVYIYQNVNNNWSFVQNLTPPEAVADQKFGIGMAMRSNFLAVGASDILSGSNSGKVYIYSSNGSSFSYSQVLAPISQAYNFGQSIAASASGIAIGAPGAVNLFSGAAFVFINNGGTWTGSTVQKPANLSSAAAFGSSVSFDGLRLAVGASRHDSANNADTGAVYYYANYSAGLTYTLNGNAAGTQLGSAVALSSDSLYVGASGGTPEDGNGNSGFVSRLMLSSLTAGGTATPNGNNSAGGFIQYSQDSTGTENFGESLASDGGSNVIVGAPAKSDPLSRSGAAYIYRVP